MLSKAKYPMLNRKARRHPKRYLHANGQFTKGWMAGGSWLLLGMMMKAGFTPAVNAEGAQV